VSALIAPVTAAFRLASCSTCPGRNLVAVQFPSPRPPGLSKDVWMFPNISFVQTKHERA
jgi:hypothetical protein